MFPIKFSNWLIPLVFFCAFNLRAQDTLLFENVQLDTTIIDKNGPNRENFRQLIGGYSMAAGPEFKGAEIKNALSPALHLGFRYKYKLSKFYQIGLGARYTYYAYRLVENNEKTILTPTKFEKSRLTLHNVSVEFYQRINLKKAGDHIPPHIDLCVFGGLFVGRGYYTERDVKNPTLGQPESIVTRQKRLDIGDPWNYGVRARFGFRHFAFISEYRLSRLFDKALGYPELPVLSFGIELSS